MAAAPTLVLGPVGIVGAEPDREPVILKGNQAAIADLVGQNAKQHRCRDRTCRSQCQHQGQHPIRHPNPFHGDQGQIGVNAGIDRAI